MRRATSASASRTSCWARFTNKRACPDLRASPSLTCLPDAPDRATRNGGGQRSYIRCTRSYADSDGDGIGDLPGVIARLDYLQWLGVDGIWLSPITVSPNADWGYDVADYCAVDPALGTSRPRPLLAAAATGTSASSWTSSRTTRATTQVVRAGPW